MLTEATRRRSLEVGSLFGHELVVVKEKKLVNMYAVKCGMQRFSFILDCCQPGSVPDAHLIAAMLDLVRLTELKQCEKAECIESKHFYFSILGLGKCSASHVGGGGGGGT